MPRVLVPDGRGGMAVVEIPYDSSSIAQELQRDRTPLPPPPPPAELAARQALMRQMIRRDQLLRGEGGAGQDPRERLEALQRSRRDQLLGVEPRRYESQSETRDRLLAPRPSAEPAEIEMPPSYVTSPAVVPFRGGRSSTAYPDIRVQERQPSFAEDPDYRLTSAEMDQYMADSPEERQRTLQKYRISQDVLRHLASLPSPGGGR